MQTARRFLSRAEPENRLHAAGQLQPGIGKAVRKNDWLETAALGWRPVAVWTSGREEVQ